MNAVTLGSMVSETIEIEIISVATGQVLSPESLKKPVTVTQEVTTALPATAIRPLVAVVDQGTQTERTYFVSDADYDAEVLTSSLRLNLQQIRFTTLIRETKARMALVEFSSTDSTSPSLPTNVNDGTSDPSTTSTPTISWVASTDNESGIARYEVAVGTSAGASNVRDWADVGNVISVKLTTGLSLTVGSMYYASVRAIDAAGNRSATASGDGWIVISSAAPSAPIVNATTPTTDTRPTWSWTSGGGGTGVFRHNLGGNYFPSGHPTTTATSYSSEITLTYGNHYLFVQEQGPSGAWSASGSKNCACSIGDVASPICH